MTRRVLAAALAALVAEARGARGQIWANAALPEGGTARIMLGRDFLIDGELAARIEALQDVRNVELKTSETRLALVG